MNKKKRRIPLTAVLAVILLVAAVAGYMLVIRPQKADVERLDSEIATKQTQIDAAVQAAEAEQEAEPTTSIRVADLVELAKAMPDQTDMAGAILELNAAAESAGVAFNSIQPGQPVAGAGYTQLPLTLGFQGSYYELTELLYRLRHLVTVREGVLDANGRLLTLDTVDWHEAEEPGFPIIARRPRDLGVRLRQRPWPRSHPPDRDHRPGSGRDGSGEHCAGGGDDDRAGRGWRRNHDDTPRDDGAIHGGRLAAGGWSELMAKKPTPEEIRKQKDARAKKLVLVMLPVLIALVAWQGPKVLNQVRGEAPPTSAAEPATTADETQPAPAVGTAPATDATTGSADIGATPATTDPGAVAVSATQTLSDTDLPPPVEEGELIAFSRFEARDPFVQLVDGEAVSGDITEANPSVSGSTGSTTAPTTTPSTATPSTGTSLPPPSVQPGTSPTVPTTSSPEVVAVRASISINGEVHELSVGDKFPQADPAFELVAVATGQVTIGLANGSFSSGVQTITLDLGKSVTLISQPDGARFTLKLVSVG